MRAKNDETMKFFKIAGFGHCDVKVASVLSHKVIGVFLMKLSKIRKPIAMNDLTQLLAAIEQGDPQAASQLMPLVYEELRRLAAQKLANEAPGLTLQPTALVHEAYLRLAGGNGNADWDSRGHFF